MARNHHVQPTRHVIYAGKKSPNGKLLARKTLTAQEERPETMKKPMMTRTMKKNPRNRIIMKTHPQANPPSKNLSQKTDSPRLRIHDYMSVRQYVMPDHPMITFQRYIKDTKGTPSVV